MIGLFPVVLRRRPGLMNSMTTPNTLPTTHPVKVTRHGDVTLVTLDRPDVRNAVDAATARQLHAAFLAFDADKSARVAVFHGANGHFCA